MRKKIKQLAYGIFDYGESKLSLSTECVELEVIEGKNVTGEFTISSGTDKKIRGMVYSTHPRMECLTPQFDGEEIRVRYQFHSEGLVEGDVKRGEFVIVCDKGEYNLSFVVSISKAYAQTSIGKVKTISDFAQLARGSMEEAYQVFYSISFSYILKDATERERLLYEAIRKEPPSMQAMEAYLVGIGKKLAVNVSLEEAAYTFYGVTESKKEQLCLKKDSWGYVTCEVSTDAAFIRLEKTSITSEEFMGNTCLFDYYIDADALHAGKNYGRIIFEFPQAILTCEVCASSVEEAESVNRADHASYLKNKIALMQLYTDYRTKKIVTGVWAKNSIEILERLLDVEPENDLYRLMKAQAYLVNRQRQEASWILEDYKRSCTKRNTPEWGYYLYLCTLMEREESYVDRLAAQIEEIFRHHSDSALLFWVLLFIREDYYRNSARRLRAIENWIEKNGDSPFFYIEAFYLLWQDPYLLTKLDKFEVKILNWARKYRVISKEIAMQIIALIPTVHTYDDKILRILEACYEVAEKEEVAAAICSYLIKGQCFAKKYHKWYAIGVRHEARITNLYEAYLLTADKESMEQVPKVIFLYFQYHNTLSYKQLALLYAFIIQNKDKYKKVYQNYRRTMEQFAMAQIEAGHIDENIAVIYQEMLPLGILNMELAEKLANVLFVHRLCVTGEKQFARAIIVQKQWKNLQIVPIIDGKAYFKAFTEDYCIILQDNKGQLFTEEALFVETALLDVESYLEQARKHAPMTVPYLLYTFDKKHKMGVFSVSDEDGFSVLMDTQEVNEVWKATLQPAFVRHLVIKDFEAQMEKNLKNANYKLMSTDDRRFMIEQLIENHEFEPAYELLQQYGYDTIGGAYKVSICSYKITSTDYDEDEFLLGLAKDTFVAGKYNDVILSYLCRYYNGPTKDMALIWKAAVDFSIDTFDMEERIISQMLYSNDCVEPIEAIYEAYCKKGGKDMVYMAYLSYFSYLYLLKDMAVSKDVFLQIEHRHVFHQDVMDVQNYALLKYYAEIGTLKTGQYKIADALLMSYTGQDIYFPFYKKLDRRLVAKYHFYDKVFVEYRTKQGTCARISYHINGEKLREEEMVEVYDGIFVKTFVLFFGDKLSYYVTEINEQKRQTVTVSEQIENHDVYTGAEQGRYAMLNDMFTNVTLQEIEELKRIMKAYSGNKISTEGIFKLL